MNRFSINVLLVNCKYLFYECTLRRVLIMILYIMFCWWPSSWFPAEGLPVDIQSNLMVVLKRSFSFCCWYFACDPSKDRSVEETLVCVPFWSSSGCAVEGQPVDILWWSWCIFYSVDGPNDDSLIYSLQYMVQSLILQYMFVWWFSSRCPVDCPPIDVPMINWCPADDPSKDGILISPDDDSLVESLVNGAQVNGLVIDV